jgi:hypothetical protein
VPAVARTESESETNNETELINDKLDELAKGMAQSVTRRGALKKFGPRVGFVTYAREFKSSDFDP